jgi:hypothetical protein
MSVNRVHEWRRQNCDRKSEPRAGWYSTTLRPNLVERVAKQIIIIQSPHCGSYARRSHDGLDSAAEGKVVIVPFA